eukprot:Awhi_evm2s14309
MEKRLFYYSGQSLWDINHLYTFKENENSIDIVIIDTSGLLGNDLLFDGLAFCRLVMNVLQPRYIIVRSKELHKKANTFVNYDFFIQRKKKLAFKRQQKQQILDKNEYSLEVSATNNDAIRIHKNEVTVVCVPGVSLYRATIPHLVYSGSDVVFEIGCAQGQSTVLIAEHINNLSAVNTENCNIANNKQGFCIGFDVSKSIVERARRVHLTTMERLNSKDRRIAFELGNAWNTRELCSFFPTPTTIFVDVGGISGVDGELEAISLVRQLTNAFQCSDRSMGLRSIVVKSQCLSIFASVFITADDLFNLDF